MQQLVMDCPITLDIPRCLPFVGQRTPEWFVCWIFECVCICRQVLVHCLLKDLT